MQEIINHYIPESRSLIPWLPPGPTSPHCPTLTEPSPTPPTFTQMDQLTTISMVAAS